MKDCKSIISTKAIYSDDKRYRYSLTKTWDENKRKAIFIGINPSDATEVIMDKTVMNLMNHLIVLQYGEVEVLNLFAYRSKKQEELVLPDIEQNAINIEYIKNSINTADLIIVGWGRTAESKPKYRDTISDVKKILKPCKKKVKCFKDKNGKINCHLSIGYSHLWSLVEYTYL